jgi:tripartite-type tricarboxylate transporter receptor subunit TctC
MKRFVWILSFFCLFSLFGSGIESPAVYAQHYPSHPIQLVIPGAPGDALDISGRMVSEELAKILKIQIIPVNKPGGGASVGTDFVAKSKKDGYTLLYSNSSGVVYNPAFNPETTPYDTLRDLEPLGMHVSFPDGIWVQSDSPWKSFADIVDYAKKNPGKFRIGTLGLGSINHFRVEIIKSLVGIDMPMIPFKGAMPAVTALLGGHTEACFSAVAITYSHYQTGKVRGILLDQKVPQLPDVPTLQQLGYKKGLPLTFFGFYAPAGIPDEAKNILVPAIEKAVKNPEISAKLQGMYFIPNYKPPAELRRMIAEDYENARQIVKQMNLTK